MSTTQHHDADRETLSALFDGELQGDSARFALKRLDHDAHWRDACGRWQLCGDVLRGQAGAVAPAGFAERVGAVVALEAIARPATIGTDAAPTRRRWIGGAALAASVAMAALFVVRPFSQSDDLPSTATQVTAASQSIAAPSDDAVIAAGQVALQEPASPVPDTTPTPGVEIGLAAAVAVAAVPRRASERRSRGQSQRAAVRNSRRQVATPVVAAVSSPPTAVAGSIDPAPVVIEPSSTHPFLPQGEIVSRPWPRAALPDYPTGNTFTASFGGGSTAAPDTSAFYPFEPRMPEPATTPGAGQQDVSDDWPRR